MMIEMTGVERSRLFPIILSEYNPAWPQWFAKEKERLVRLIDSLPKSEYVCLRQQTIPSNDRALLLKGYTSSGFAERVYHVHVRCHGDWDEPHFRDYLIAHPEAADAYAVLKRKLKERFEFDRDGYTNAKGEFIKAVTKRARNIAERMDEFFAARIDIYEYNMLHNAEGVAEGYVELAKHIPHALNTLAFQNQSIIYSILFKAAAESITELATDKKFLGASIGLTAVLHTWGQNLMHHPHIHCIVPGGGINPLGRWTGSRKKFFLPVKVLSRKFRGKFLSCTTKHHV